MCVCVLCTVDWEIPPAGLPRLSKLTLHIICVMFEHFLCKLYLFMSMLCLQPYCKPPLTILYYIRSYSCKIMPYILPKWRYRKSGKEKIFSSRFTLYIHHVMMWSISLVTPFRNPFYLCYVVLVWQWQWRCKERVLPRWQQNLTKPQTEYLC